MRPNNRIALGTVQFGCSYGVANSEGQVGIDEIFNILNYAWAHGVNTLDTAAGYGDSEYRLGRVGIKKWKIITKLPALSNNCKDIKGEIRQNIDLSLKKLDVNNVYGLLLHYPQQLMLRGGDLIYKSICSLRDEGLVNKVGISIYSPDELCELCSRYEFNIIQSPYNILDRRIVTSGWLARLKKKDVEIHIRSIFLQGLLLLDEKKRPNFFLRWCHLWNSWQQWMNQQCLTPLQACLAMAASQPDIDRILVGVDSLAHLKQILENINAGTVAPPETIMSEDQDLINPSRWEVV